MNFNYCELSPGRFVNLVLGLVLLFVASSGLESLATPASIKTVYFNSDNTVILETEGELQVHKITTVSKRKVIVHISNARFKSWNAEIKSEDFEIDFDNDDGFVQVEIESRAEHNLVDAKLRTILEGQAYELNIIGQLADADAPLDPKKEEMDLFLEDIANDELQLETKTHQLSAVKNSFLFFAEGQVSESQKFIDSLEQEQIDRALKSEDFEKDLFRSVDSTSLQAVGDALAKAGYKTKAVEAYRKAVAMDPDNLQAQLGLARNTENQMERTKSYLKTLSSEALLSVADHWFEASRDNANPQTLSASMLAYQFAILKDPRNPSLRFRYADLLERAGSTNYKQAAKRYFEAASLAKKDFEDGDKFSESLMRKSLEALIRLEATQGQFESAYDYCQSYLALGYKKFSYGDRVQAFMKKIRSKRNPFWRVTQEFRKSFGLKEDV